MVMASLGLKLPRVGGSPGWTFEKTAGEWGKRAEEAGYHSIWAAEGWGANVMVELSQIAMMTDELYFGTAIANVYSRSAAVLAMGGASLTRLSGGRAILGLGASHPGFIEGLHNIDYEQPVRRSHETMELIRELSQSEKPVEYKGELFQTEGFAPLETPFPIYNAALGSANRRATGRLADGWIPYLLPKSQLNAAWEDVATAARDADRDPADITVTPQILAAVDDDPEVARKPIRDYVATYIGSFDAYRRIIAEDFPEETAAVAEAYDNGDEDEARTRVTDEMLEEFGVAGTPDAARDQLRDVMALDAVDRVIVYPPAGIDSEMLDRTIDELSPQAV